MKTKSVWTNYKIYAFILGIITGTIVYNLLGIDFSFCSIEKITGLGFRDSLLYLLMINARFGILVLVLSFFRIKNKIIFFIIFIESFLMAGFITISILSGSPVLLYEIPMVVFKIICAIVMFQDKKRALCRILAFIILFVGTVLENIFFINF
jgi:hypothetical protein